jgi:hypothetical protein
MQYGSSSGLFGKSLFGPREQRQESQSRPNQGRERALLTAHEQTGRIVERSELHIQSMAAAGDLRLKAALM